MKQRDASIELLRCIACAIVIGTHVSLPIIANNHVDVSRLLISCLVADGAAIFWFITGFFIFSSDWPMLMKKAIRSIAIPLLLFTLFMFQFGGYLIDGVPLSVSMHHTLEEYKHAALSIISLQNPNGSMIHTWFLFTYLLFMLMFPIFKSFVDWLDESSRRERAFLIVSLVCFIWNDVTHNQLASFSATSINGVIPAAIEMIWGHILYRNRSKLHARCKRIGYALVPIFVFIALKPTTMCNSICQISRQSVR